MSNKSKDNIERLLHVVPDSISSAINFFALIVLVIFGSIVLGSSIKWLLFVFDFSNYSNIPDASSIEIFSGIVGFLISMLIFWTALRTENSTVALREFLSRSWSGVQTDYGKDLANSKDQAKVQVTRHIDDIERGMKVPFEETLDKAYFMLSSIAYGIENGSKELGRFISVLEHVLKKHSATSSLSTFREVKIAIWPKIEHQIIWGADRKRLRENAQKADAIEQGFTPSLTQLVTNSDDPAGKKWAGSLPSWCRTEAKMLETIRCLSRIAELIKWCGRHSAKVKLEIDEIDQWSGRAFFCQFGEGQCFTHYIATTPIRSSTLSASEWTTMGFSSSYMTSFRQFERVYDTCRSARHSYSEPVSSTPNSDADDQNPNDDGVIKITKQFIIDPYKLIGEYFLLPKDWQHWTLESPEFKAFYRRVHRNKGKKLNDPTPKPPAATVQAAA